MNQTTIKLYRHGENVFEKLDKLPENLTETKTDIFAKGSHGNNHTFRGGKLYLKNESNVVFGYFEAKDTTLYHSTHGDTKADKLKSAKLPDGFYRLRKGQEIVNREFQAIKD